MNVCDYWVVRLYNRYGLKKKKVLNGLAVYDRKQDNMTTDNACPGRNKRDPSWAPSWAGWLGLFAG